MLLEVERGEVDEDSMAEVVMVFLTIEEEVSVRRKVVEFVRTGVDDDRLYNDAGKPGVDDKSGDGGLDIDDEREMVGEENALTREAGADVVAFEKP